MILEVDNVLVAGAILEEEFVCNLKACKGACCVEGDAGAPLEEEELETLEAIYEDVKPYMRPEGIAAVEEQGLFTVDQDNEYVTPLVEGKECAFVAFDVDGTAKCSIEQAHKDGKVDFKKPISCHLYPIRVSKLSVGDAVNYNRWHICSDACSLGRELNVKVYQFLKEPLIRKYGKDWFEQLEIADQMKAQNT